MKRTALWIALLLSTSAHAAPWTYRGTLNDGGAPANGRFDIRLSLLDASGAKSLAYPLTFTGVEVKNGAFAVDVDFGIDLVQFGVLKLKTEIGQAGSGFVALGEPKAFDAKAALGGVCWDTTGNSGNVAGTNFLGNADAVPVDLRSSNKRVARLWKPTASSTNVLLGGSTNEITASAIGASILGGGQDDALSSVPNTVSDHYGTVGGGIGNHAGNDDGDPVNSQYSTVAGGFGNYAFDYGAVVGGGYGNSAGGYDNGYGTVSGGASNSALGDYATVPGGRNNQANGDNSFAAGRGARVRGPVDTGEVVGTCGGTGTCGDEGTFVWADSRVPGFTSSGPNQFLVRADGGFLMNTNTLPTINDDFVISARTSGGDADGDLVLRSRTGKLLQAYIRDADGVAVFNPSSATGDTRIILGSASPVALRYLNTSTGAYLSTAGVWTDNSSRALKTDFTPVDAQSILDKVLALPLSEWSYRVSPEARHLGPVAEDFHMSFGIGESPTHIASLDSAGVALAAIQGLNARLESELAQERNRNDALQAQLEQLSSRLEALEANPKR